MLIDPKSPVPVFRQIADQLRRLIESGAHHPGEMLPSQRALAIEIRVNANTVQRAYETLEREGVVESRRGVGMFVCHNNLDKLNAAEKRLVDQVSRALRQAAKSGLTPDAMRSSFEAAMRQHLQEARQ